ncbi:uncharacterized protein RCC_08027 [Ramularia collo-cygni]|uniref:F-box domain-containing protein n=1 Tax=Ramularia collo-cygni TaxID=112498 RepID=A0A2D3V2W1_9PEZI|nr:uncharacterized protein RCC_08027 [Ramularia collo-cygni]CZT22158.1 uncharacterized protein RCC_08027 [Ramularia collo-cygni]
MSAPMSTSTFGTIPPPILLTPSPPRDHLSGLPSELHDLIFRYLDLCDIAHLHQASRTFPIDWINVTRDQQDNIINNTKFCDKLRSDVRNSRNPRKLKPLPTSSLPQDRTYAELLKDPTQPRDLVRIEKQEHLAALRDGLLFKSNAFRNDRDAPLSESKERLGLREDNSDTYVQLINQATSERERVGFESQRIRDERTRMKAQADRLGEVIYKLFKDPLFLPRTCRNCLVHTVKTGPGVAYDKVFGVVHCGPCGDKRLSINHILTGHLYGDLISLVVISGVLGEVQRINRRVHLDTAWVKQFTTQDWVGFQWISKDFTEIFAQCFAGVTFAVLRDRPMPLPLDGVGYGGQEAADKFNICSTAATLATQWYTQGAQQSSPQGQFYHNIQPDLSLRCIFWLRVDLSGAERVIEIYKCMASYYEKLPGQYPNKILLGEDVYIRKFATHFWHEQLFKETEKMLVDVLIVHLKLPADLFDPTMPIISLPDANRVVYDYFGCTLSQMACAMLSLQNTSVDIPFVAVVRRAVKIIIDQIDDNDMVFLIASLAVLGDELPSRIFGPPPTHVPLRYWMFRQNIPRDEPYAWTPSMAAIAAGFNHEAYPSAIWYEVAARTAPMPILLASYPECPATESSQLEPLVLDFTPSTSQGSFFTSTQFPLPQDATTTIGANLSTAVFGNSTILSSAINTNGLNASGANLGADGYQVAFDDPMDLDEYDDMAQHLNGV